jgi:hypothetical protein
MNDKLEKFIKEHRSQFDAGEPRPDLWIDIANEMNDAHKQKSLRMSNAIWRAAAVILLLVTSWLVVEKIIQKPESAEMYVNQDLQEAEAFYFSLISKKKQEVIELSDALNIGNEFENEINKLDAVYDVLRDNLKNGNQEDVVDAMILNLQLRIEILNQQLNIIQTIVKSKSEKNKENETIRL